jgi:hypothetical protein
MERIAAKGSMPIKVFGATLVGAITMQRANKTTVEARTVNKPLEI